MTIHQRTCLVCVLALAVTAMGAGAAPLPKTTLMVPMRDGVKLATDLYLPAQIKEPVPAILMRTPYGKNQYHEMAAQCHRQGYAWVVQDMRGRFESEGRDALVFLRDGWGRVQDGHDAIDWVARQPWCDGRVATWGASAMGISQNMLAPDAPEALKAHNVAVAFSDMYHQAAYQGGVFRKALVEGWLKNNAFEPENLKTLLAHPHYDGLWEQLNPEAQAEQVNAPGMFTGGWYDIFLQGTINSFLSIQHRGGPRARGNCRLVLFPIAHGKFEDLVYPKNSKRPPRGASAMRFLDHFVRGRDNGADQDLPVHYYVMGDPTDPDAPGNIWRSAVDWPPPAKLSAFYFHADGGLNRTRPEDPTAQRSFRFDPADPVPTLGGANLNIAKGPMDQRPVEGRKDVLLFSSDVLKEPLEVTGRLRARLYVSSDCPDTDFTVKLTDVYPDGRSMLVTDGIQRASLRESCRQAKLLEPGQVYALKVDLWSTSLIFNRGHRIRLAVSSSNYPRFAANPNTGEARADWVESRVANNTVHLSREHPSHLVLPLPGKGVESSVRSR